MFTTVITSLLQSMAQHPLFKFSFAKLEYVLTNAIRMKFSVQILAMMRFICMSPQQKCSADAYQPCTAFFRLRKLTVFEKKKWEKNNYLLQAIYCIYSMRHINTILQKLNNFYYFLKLTTRDGYPLLRFNRRTG